MRDYYRGKEDPTTPASDTRSRVAPPRSKVDDDSLMQRLFDSFSKVLTPPSVRKETKKDVNMNDVFSALKKEVNKHTEPKLKEFTRQTGGYSTYTHSSHNELVIENSNWKSIGFETYERNQKTYYVRWVIRKISETTQGVGVELDFPKIMNKLLDPNENKIVSLTLRDHENNHDVQYSRDVTDNKLNDTMYYTVQNVGERDTYDVSEHRYVSEPENDLYTKICAILEREVQNKHKILRMLLQYKKTQFATPIFYEVTTHMALQGSDGGD
jgi:hypothetical protein